MEYTSLQQLLQRHQPTDTTEQECKKQMLEFVTEHANCFERSLEQGHITASAWLVNKDDSQALLMHHAKLDAWFQLGGHCDGDPNVLAVAIKEAQEESGINNIVPAQQAIFDIDIHLIPAYKDIPAHYHYDVRFLLRVVSDEQVIQNSESKELRWVAKDRQALPTDSPSVVRMFTKWAQL